MIPDAAELEAQVAGGIALYDISGILPKHPHKRYRNRPLAGIVRQYHHHSGALGRDGWQGALGTARYAASDWGRDWAGAPYHYWLAKEPDRDGMDRLVVYRLQPDEVRCYHTGGPANTHGVGVCWQGNLSNTPPSLAQVEMAEALVPWLCKRHRRMRGDRAVSFHSESKQFGGSGKKSCPGPYVESWIRAWRGD
jgi:hypothetical protein